MFNMVLIFARYHGLRTVFRNSGLRTVFRNFRKQVKFAHNLNFL